MRYVMFSVFLLVPLLMASKAVLAEPVISFADKTVDFGDVNQGDLLEHTFVFSNDGTDVLVIEKVTAS
ncbi:MAG: DUF1573 domain-containing protein [Nitrospirae bacterium]|nr:DUF1573 domain-containing protein [Nitrospirota bacterium]